MLWPVRSTQIPAKFFRLRPFEHGGLIVGMHGAKSFGETSVDFDV